MSSLGEDGSAGDTAGPPRRRVWDPDPTRSSVLRGKILPGLPTPVLSPPTHPGPDLGVLGSSKESQRCGSCPSTAPAHSDRILIPNKTKVIT